VNALISVEGLVESPPVTLSLHVPRLDLPLLEEVRHPLGNVVIVDHVAEVIKSQILHLGMIALGEAKHLRCRQVFVLAHVRSGKGLETISHHVTIKTH
jgi:hypothetical protein